MIKKEIEEVESSNLICPVEPSFMKLKKNGKLTLFSYSISYYRLFQFNGFYSLYEN